MFKKGTRYTRDEIHAAVGGSKQWYIPTVNGSIVAVCVTPKLNPRAPRELLCGRGPVIAKTGAILAATTRKVPVFMKRGVNQWEFAGFFRTVGSHTSGPRFNAMVAGSGRLPSDVSVAIELAP
jgi:hypothetical protein